MLNPPILTQAQALAVYRAMCELNNVSAYASVRLPCSLQLSIVRTVRQVADGGVIVGEEQAGRLSAVERFKDQAAFREFYGIPD
jgi:hypothetical protein